jgi:hypothetical protein
MNLPTSQSAYPGDVVTNHDDLIKFLASQQKRINLLETHVRGLRGTYDLLRGSNNNWHRVVLDSPKAEKPEAMLNQQHQAPPPELVQQWLWSDDCSLGPLITITSNRLQNVATQAARWGDDQRLKACVQLLDINGCPGRWIDMLRAALSTSTQSNP